MVVLVKCDQNGVIMTMMYKKLGIIAGGGCLPRLLIEHCQKTGRDYFVLAIENNADKAVFSPDIPHQWVRIGHVFCGWRSLTFPLLT